MIENTTLMTGRDGIVEKITKDGETYLWAHSYVADKEQRFSLVSEQAARRFAGITQREAYVCNSTDMLRGTIATLNPDGTFANEVRWAKEELDRRGVDYSDCLEPAR